MLLLTCGASVGAEPATEPSSPVRSRFPRDVVLDYSYDALHLMNGAGAPLYGADERYPRFLERLKAFPPDVLIVGKEAPFTHSVGPVLSFGGENRTFPTVRGRKGEDTHRLLSPAELRLRVAAARRFTEDAHAAGVKAVLPYMSPVAMLGDPKERKGFFEFFDRWDEYAKEFELGPSPEGDPLDWTQQDAKGQPYYRFGADKPEYKSLRRYTMSVNAPGWRRWLVLHGGWAARAGYDGLWLDNFGLLRSYDPGTRRLAQEMGVNLMATGATSVRTLQRVWLEGDLRLLDALRAEGRKHGKSFVLAANYGEIPFQEAVTDRLDLTMIERTWLGASRLIWPHGIWTAYYPAMPDRKVILNRTTGTQEPQVLQNLWTAQLAYAMRRGGPHLIYGAPAVLRDPAFAHNRSSAVLALAEAAAFGGGSSVQVVGSGGPMSPFLNENDREAHRGRERFFSFARANRSLYEGLLPAGDVALVVYPNEGLEGLLEAQQVHDALLWRGLLVDVVNGETATPAALERYGLVVVPGSPAAVPAVEAGRLLGSPDPNTREDVRTVTQGAGGRNTPPPLRRTRLPALAVQRANGLRALTLPEGSRIQGSAWSDDRRVVLHLLDFRTPIGRDSEANLAPPRAVEVRLRVPAGRKVTQVRLAAPGAPQYTSAAFRQEGRVVSFTVPALQVYTVADVALQ